MADLAPVVGAILEITGPMLQRALGAFFKTALGMATLAVLCIIGGCFICAKGSVLRTVIIVGCGVVIFTIAGLFLGLKRAIGNGLLVGFSSLHAGEKTSRLLFTRILQVDEHQQMGERGIAIARAAERVPLDVAEQKLQRAIDWTLRISHESTPGFVRRTLKRAAVARVAAVTLAKFRSENAEFGGVDLAKVGNEVATQIDGLVVKTVSGALLKVTMAIVLGASLAFLGVAVALRHFMH